MQFESLSFPISRDPPEGGTFIQCLENEGERSRLFPISRDPPEGGTDSALFYDSVLLRFPISRDPPEGGTVRPEYRSLLQ